MDLQIDDFYKDAAAAMLQLYQAFPRKHALYVEDLIGREPHDEFGLPSSRHQSCFSALLWLADEGYLRYESNISYDALDQAVLTEKGFLRLSGAALATDPELPSSIGRVQSSLAHQLRLASREHNSEKIVQLARLLFEPAK